MRGMQLDPDRCYRALQAHDSRFDGRFFVGVSSTRIYCRPVCAGKPPKRENCTFHPSAAAAEAAGFRPCLRCRPELAPGNATVDAAARLAQQAASLIEDGGADGTGLEALAERLGVSDRHLRRVFQAEFGVSPVAFAQTQRLLLAKRLMTDTRLSATEVAMASGFNSLRRFNALFRDRYRLKPTDLRRTTGGAFDRGSVRVRARLSAAARLGGDAGVLRRSLHRRRGRGARWRVSPHPSHRRRAASSIGAGSKHG